MNKHNSFEKLLDHAKVQLKKEKAPEHLWQSISDELDLNKVKKWPDIFTGLINLVNNSYYKKRVFVFVAATVLGLFFVKTLINPQLLTVAQTEKFAKNLDENIYRERERYEKAINKIDIDYLNQGILTADGETSLFVERLLFLDNTISRCKSALVINPYSVAVNTSLITAYQDKISALDQLNNKIKRIS